MTQLPEVEVVRKDLEKGVIGKRVKAVTVSKPSMVGRHRNRPAFSSALEGRKLTGVARRGTWLVLELDEGQSLVVRLGPLARLVRETARAQPGTDTQVVITFTTGGALHLVDPRADSELFVTQTSQLDAIAELTRDGVDPLAGTFTWTAFGQHLAVRRQPLRSLLLDESVILGLGDLYADEILWAAALAGSRQSDQLSSQEVRRLYRAVFEVLYDAVKQGGTNDITDADGNPDDPGHHGGQLKVFGHEGQPCPRCRRLLRKGEADGRPTYYCASCQT